MPNSQTFRPGEAVAIITRGLETAPLPLLRRLLCAAVGHPPVIEYCFGQHTCARCTAIVGDSLAGADRLTGKAIIGHHCEDCDAVILGLTEEQRLLTPVTEAEAETARQDRLTYEGRD